MSTAVATKETTDDKLVQWVPLGGAEAIKLSVVIIQNLLAKKTKKGFACSRADATRFMMMCQARHLNPFEGDAFLIGYDTQDGPEFSIVTAHQAFLKRAELHPQYKGMDSGIIVKEKAVDFPMGDKEQIDPDRTTPGVFLRTGEFHFRLQKADFYVPGQTVVGGWATVTVEGKVTPTHRRLRLERFNKGRAQWIEDAAGMICKCAEADALRSSFPTHLGGMYLAGEMQPQIPSGEAAELTATVKSLVEVRNGPEREPAKETERAENDQIPGAEGPAEDLKDPAHPDLPSTPQIELALTVEAAGADWRIFVRWCAETGSLGNLPNLKSWDDIPTVDAQRLLKPFRGARSRALILEQLTKLKEEL